MRMLDKIGRVGRRGFLSGTTTVLALTAGALHGNGAFAASLKHLSPRSAPTLLVLVRDLYPHDRLTDDFYERALVAIDAGLTPEQAAQVADGVKALDAAARAAHGKHYEAVAKEADRIALLKQVEDQPFFQKLRGGMVTALYNQPEVWAKLGYEGPSAAKGGYLHRGFDDLDWLENT